MASFHSSMWKLFGYVLLIAIALVWGWLIGKAYPS